MGPQMIRILLPTLLLFSLSLVSSSLDPPSKVDFHHLRVLFQENGNSVEKNFKKHGEASKISLIEDKLLPLRKVIRFSLGPQKNYIQKAYNFSTTKTNFISFLFNPNGVYIPREESYSDSIVWVGHCSIFHRNIVPWSLNLGFGPGNSSSPYYLALDATLFPLKSNWNRITIGFLPGQWVSVWVNDRLALTRLQSYEFRFGGTIYTLFGNYLPSHVRGSVLMTSIEHLVSENDVLPDPFHPDILSFFSLEKRADGEVVVTSTTRDRRAECCTVERYPFPVSGIMRFVANLTGSQVVPPVTDTRGFGQISLNYSKADQVTYSINWLGLNPTTIRGLTLNNGNPNENGPVALTLFSGANAPPVSGANLTTTTATQLGLLRDGLLTPNKSYVIMPTSTYPNGEIRGNLQRVQYPPPSLTQAFPTYGFISGGLNISLFGTGFLDTPELACQFGWFGSVRGYYLSPTRIYCITPDAARSQETPLRVTNDGFTYSNSVIFNYLNPVPRLTRVTPSTGPQNGGIPVTVYGRNFTVTTDTRPQCDFGGNLVVATTVARDGSFVVCTMPIVNKVGCLALRVTNDGSAFSNPLEFIVTPQSPTATQPAINNIQPNSAPITGGVTVTIRGRGFSRSPFLSCLFSGIAMTRATIVYQLGTSGIITCPVPSITPPAQVPPTNISLRISNDGQFFSPPIPFSFYVPSPVVYSVSAPNTGAFTSGGARFDLRGINFVGINLTCHFNNATVPAYLDDLSGYTHVFCFAPALPVGQYTLGFSNDGVNIGAGTNTVTINSLPVPAITQLYPRIGNTTSGTEVTVIGRNLVLSPNFRCIINGVNVPGYRLGWYLESPLLCTVPPSTVFGRVPFYVTNDINNPGLRNSESYFFTYLVPAPSVLTATPRLAVVNRIFSFNITGSNFFNSSSLRCYFNRSNGEAVSSVPATYVNTTFVRCTFPPISTAGIYSLYVSNDGLVQSSSPVLVQFLALPVPVLSRLLPASVPTYTSSRVTVIGNDFTASALCRTINTQFGSSPITSPAFSVINSTHVVCNTPNLNAPTNLSLYVTNDGQFFSNALTLVFFTPPIQLQSITPTSAEQVGGTVLYITGDNFQPIASLLCVWSLGTFQQNFTATYINSTTVTCTSPAFPVIGNATLRILGGGGLLSSPLSFMVTTVLPRVARYGPNTSPLEGGIFVYFYGDRFFNITPTCRFGSVGNVPATFISSTRMMCTSPAVRNPVNVTVELSNDGVSFYPCCPFAFLSNWGNTNPFEPPLQ
eukprot:TRINITY_DN1508_c0_g1_i1.p1 TRINITY_DN1508_c0_g1~~TRINITY_DN1508_c0_g1_i1.p1  ORF type:complete len:1256 (-),score=270.64 TRINITY_DN1508_c0_g1_i1:251-4018(-)